MAHLLTLAPGCSLVDDPRPATVADPDSAAAVLVAGPDEQLASVVLPGNDVALLRSVVTGALTEEAALASAAAPETLAATIEACREAGWLGAVEPPRADRLSVTLLGAGPLATDLAASLTAAGVTVHPVAEPADVSSDAIPVAVADVLPDARWSELDAWFARRAQTWHRVHGEGDRLSVGPCSVPGVGASYRDLRTRRLAAAAHPAELELLWAAWQDPAAPTGSRPAHRHGPDLVAAAVAHVVADLSALSRGTTPPGALCQVLLAPGGPIVTRHPVLPVPQGLAGGRR